jgi:hypothetical protein
MIRFGMKLPEIFNQLVKGYQKVRGQKPTGLDLIKIKQEAMLRFQEMRKILDMQGNPINPSKPIIGGKQLDKNAPGYFNDFTSMMIKDANVAPKVVKSGIMKTKEAMNPKFIDFTIDSFKNMDGIKVMKEANKIIKREGPYKDLTKNDAKRIMDAVDDKLKNIDMDPEDMYADGGRIGYAGGSDMGTVSGATRSANTGLKGGYQNTGTSPVERPGGGGGSKPPPVVTRTVTKPNVKDKIRRVGNTIGDISYFKNLINLNPLGIAKNVGGKILMDKILGDQSSLDTEDENNGIMKMADVSAADINRLIDPVSKKPKYSSSQDVDDIRMFEEAAGFEFNPTITDQEIRDVLDKKITRPTGQFAADGGRIGLKDGEGIMQMASNDMNERLLEKIFDDLLDQGMDPEEAEIKAREILNEMGDTSSIPDRGAPSITLADGGRAAFKDGTGMFEKLFFNKERPILSGLNTTALFDLVVAAKDAAGPFIGLADGGRAAFKDGPKDPRRRTFMKAAAGIASMLPFGASKIIGKAAPVVAKAAELSGPALNKIIETVMTLGKTISQSGRRVKEMITKKKHKGIEVEEDIMDGSYTIKKGGKEIYYKPGKRDEMGIEDDIIEVIEKTVTKKASGGVARMLGE